jgi:hypothetical protein
MVHIPENFGNDILTIEVVTVYVLPDRLLPRPFSGEKPLGSPLPKGHGLADRPDGWYT